ncbi:Glutathione S-transferase 1-like protein 4 [Colletotrichum chlorophyti]|uniref:Glutathione S-transferase 1-like protein 4 n=1 Tax=Colletotrichum chlorophyti TaxID=708187 RepID=A0A1Q8RFH8_9PEZI|nr:Glutathione S-transferase 1-like protein 4 [Colletotrichum chlorophyti]
MADEQQPKVKLYWLEQSRAQNILWLLEELKIEYEVEVFHRDKQTKLAPPELAKVHPLGKSPVIEIFPTGSGESIKLAESGYMTQYLCDHFGQGTNLIPKKWKEGQEGKIGGETEEWMRCQYLLHYVEGSLLPVLTLSLVIGALKSDNIPFFVRPITSAVANKIYSMMVFPNAKKHLALLDQMLETSPGGGKYICGAHLSAADILLSFALIAAEPRFDSLGSWPGGSARAAHPRLFEYIDRLKKEPGYERSAQKIREIDGKFEATISRILLASAATIGAVRQNSTASLPSIAAENAPKATSQPPRSGAPNTYSKLPTRKQKGASNQARRQRALDLFESTVNSKANVVPEPSQEADLLYRLAAQLDDVLQNKEKLPKATVASRAYTLMATKLLPARKPGTRLPQVLNAKVMQALRQVIDAKFEALDAPELPNVADILKMYADLDQKKLAKRLELMRGLLRAIVTPRSELESPAADARLLDDLVECWKHLSGLRRADSGLQSESKFWLTTRPDMRGIEDPQKLFRALFPLFASNELHGLGPLLVTTYVLLSESKHILTKAKEEAQPLLDALDPIVKRFDQEMLRYLFDGHPELWAYVQPRADWRVTRMAPEAWKETHVPPVNNSNQSQSTGRFSYAQWHRRFGTAFRANDHAAARQAWRDLVDPVNDSNRAQRLRDSPELLDYFLFLSCGKYGSDATSFSKLTAEVLAYMKSIGMEPTLRTYTSMMNGWKQARRLDLIENLWASINRAGLKLDQQVWSSRIDALGHMGHEDAGLAALKEMEKTWDTAVKNGAQSKAVQPGIACVNAAISGLLRRDRMDVIRKVLDWAIEKGIQPDIYTYNMLLARMLRKGAVEEADRILGGMKTAGITPDGATFTIILEAALDELPDQTPHEQRATIDRVFGEMAACGIEPNQETYAKMLHILVKAGDVAQVSVAAVLAHLRRSGQQLATEICTILVEYYVSRSRPDLDSIRALVADRRSRTRALTDRVFWESVIKHYHRAGDLDGALEIFYDLDDWGIWPALPLLEPLLRSLVYRKDWDAAQKLVTTVRRQARPQAADREGRFWKHAFWAVAKDYDLLEQI